MSKSRTRAKAARGSVVREKPVHPWPRLLAEAVLLALVVLIPIIINRYSRNFLDAKDAALGIGVTLGLSLWLIASLVQGRFSWVSSRLNLAVWMYLLWAAISIGYAGRYWFVSISEFGRLAANVGVFFLAAVALRTPAQVRRVLIAACVSAVPVSIYAFMQATGHDFIQWKEPVTRVHSTLGNSTYLGGYCSLLLPFAAALAWPERRDEGAPVQHPFLRPLLVAVVIVMLTITLYLSFTFAAILGLGLGLIPVCFLLLWREGRAGVRKVSLLVLLALAVAAPIGYGIYRAMPASQQRRVQQVFSRQDPASAERRLHWRTAYRLFAERPVTGWGYGTYRIHSLGMMGAEWYRQSVTRTEGMLAPGYAHNEPLQALADTGVIGLATLVILVVLGYGLAFRVSLRHPDPAWRRIGLATTAAMTCFLFQNLVGVTFHQTGTVTFFWLWLGLLAVAEAHVPRGSETAEAVRVRGVRAQRQPVAAAVAGIAAVGLVALIAWLSIRPAIADVTVREAQVLAGEGQYQASVAAADRTLELCPYSALAYYTLAFAYGNLGQYDQALQANLKSLELMPDNGSALYNLGVVYQQMGRLDEAGKAFQGAVDVMPSPENYIGLSETMLKLGRLDQAEAGARQAADLLGARGGEEAKQAQVYLLLADIASRRKDIEKMLAYSGQAAAIAPTDVNVQSNLIRLLLGARRERQAEEAARTWAAADPQSAKPLLAVAAVEYGAKNYAAAKQTLTRAVQLEPDNLQARLNLAYTLGQLHDLAGFRQEMERIAATGGEGPEAKAARAALARFQAPPPQTPPPGAPPR